MIPCDCDRTRCAAHPGEGTCRNLATKTIRNVGAEEWDASNICDACAADALETFDPTDFIIEEVA